MLERDAVRRFEESVLSISGLRDDNGRAFRENLGHYIESAEEAANQREHSEVFIAFSVLSMKQFIIEISSYQT